MANSDAPRSENSKTPRNHGESELRASFATTASSVKPRSSPLLSSTPPTVAKALVKAYPYLLIVNKSLAVITWTNDDYWINIVLMCIYAFAVLYFETLVTWSGHLILVGAVIVYAVLNNRILEETNLRPTLDDVVQALTTTCIKADILLSPVTALALTPYDIKRLLFTTVFLTPLYLVATSLLIKPRTILLHAGLFLLSYHSGYSRVTRRLVWKLKLTRVVCFYLTGLDFSQARNSSLFAAAFAKVQKTASSTSTVADPSKPVRFTYVIYENQRRWLGIGWTSNLLSYERAPWTDEFLNESSSVETFELPNPDSATSEGQQSYLSHPTIAGAHWRWVDKAWRLDVTNDGSITLPSGKRSKTTANPTADEGFLYFDNVWKKPSTEDSYSKYTRRRRWVRTAELVFSNSTEVSGDSTPYSSGAAEHSLEDSATKNRKNLRFVEEPEPLSDATVEADISSDGADKKHE